MQKAIRLSPSGPYLAKDGTSGLPLPQGDGTPGLIWRAQGTQGVQDDINTPGALVAISGLEMAVEMLAGYRYDVQCDLSVFGSNSTSQLLTVAIEASTDGGSTWQDLGLTRETRVHVGTGGGQAHFGESRKYHAVGQPTIDRVRVRAWGTATTSAEVYAGNSFLRVEQYVEG